MYNLDEIKEFNYTVSDSDSKLFKEKFKELKKVLSEKEIDNKKYATLVFAFSSLFLGKLGKVTKLDFILS